MLWQKCADSALTVLAELRKCGLTDNENCLKTVTLSLNGGDTVRARAGRGWGSGLPGGPWQALL